MPPRARPTGYEIVSSFHGGARASDDTMPRTVPLLAGASPWHKANLNLSARSATADTSVDLASSAATPEPLSSASLTASRDRSPHCAASGLALSSARSRRCPIAAQKQSGKSSPQDLGWTMCRTSDTTRPTSDQRSR